MLQSMSSRILPCVKTGHGSQFCCNECVLGVLLTSLEGNQDEIPELDTMI